MKMPHCRFGATPEQQTELARLILRGIKTATCSALLDYQENPETLPHPGDRFVVEDGDGKAVCVIETTDVRFIRFCDVDATFAFAEGEGDRSLENWRAEHQRFFTDAGMFAFDMMLVCERFKIVQDFASERVF